MRASPLRTICLVLLAGHGLVLGGAAGDKGFRRGDRVRVSIGPAALREGDKLVATLPAQTELVVLAMDGRQVKVAGTLKGRAVEGWVHEMHLALVARAREGGPESSSTEPVAGEPPSRVEERALFAIPGHERFDLATFTLAPQGNSVAVRLRAKGGAPNDPRYYLVWDGKELGGPYDLGEPTFSRNGRSLAYAARIGERRFVGRDGEVVAEGYFPDELVVAPDGSSVAFAAFSRPVGGLHLVLDGEVLTRKASSRPAFSPDGRTFLYAYASATVRGEIWLAEMTRGLPPGARPWLWNLRKHLRRYLPFERILYPTFSADGSTLVLIVKRKEEENNPWAIVKARRRGAGRVPLVRPAHPGQRLRLGFRSPRERRRPDRLLPGADPRQKGQEPGAGDPERPARHRATQAHPRACNEPRRTVHRLPGVRHGEPQAGDRPRRDGGQRGRPQRGASGVQPRRPVAGLLG